MGARLPVFPLGTVLFPGLVLPLHIFEERYRELVRDLVALPDGTPREFGVVAIRRGWEVLPVTGPAGDLGDDDPRPAGSATVGAAAVTLHDVGCTAELRQVTELADGRFDIVTVGRRRFRVGEVDADSTSYLTAEVDWLTEPPGQEALAELLAPRVLATFGEYLRLLRPDTPDVIEQIPDDPTVLSHLVAATASLTVEDRQELLAAADTATRLRAELRLLSREAALLRRVRAVPVPLSELAGPVNPN
ncbi:MAG TPA: LON peptidase substrate-binding domain-containing protein [Catenuloplanes sp.]